MELLTMSATYDFWQNKKNGLVFAVKFFRGRPARICGPLNDNEYRTADGRLMRYRLQLLHYGFAFADDPYNYLICD